MCGSKGTSTSTSSYSPPPEVAANYKMLSDRANSVANTPFQPYTGEMIAGLTPTQEAGISNINASSNLAQPYYQAASGYEQAGATPFSQQALNQYMSPYLNNVVGATMANLNETNAHQQQQLAGNAISKGAFGGDRGNIAQSELTRQQNLATGQTLANVLQGGYGQALGQFNASNAQNLATGQSLGQLGAAAQNSGLQGAQAQLAGGAQQQAVRQAQDVANQQQFQAAQAYPFQTTQYLANLLLGIGGQSGGTSLTSQPGPNIGSQVLGTIGTLASIPWGSDERLKENMEPVGKTFDGQNIYKFNYKNDGHTMLGLSAQEVEKHNPSAVHKDGDGMRMVDYEKAVNGAAQRGHFASGGVTDWMGGGVKADGLGRAHFAFDGSVPYSDQPSGGSTKPLTLADVMRVSQGLLSQKAGGHANIPNAPAAYQDTGLQDAQKGIMNAMSNKEIRANVANNINSLKSNLGLGTVSPASLLNLEGNLQYSTGMPYASGGVVGRHGYAEDGTVKPDPQATQTSQNGQSLIERMTGQPLSDNARMGLLSASLGMLSSRSPFFGVGVGEGATQGLNTYYNAQANDRAYQNQLAQRALDERKVKVEEGGLGLRGVETNIALQTADQNIYQNLRDRAAAYLSVPGGVVPPELLSEIDTVNKRISARMSGLGAAGGVPKQNVAGVVPTNEVLTKAPVTSAPVTSDVSTAKQVLTNPPVAEQNVPPKGNTNLPTDTSPEGIKPKDQPPASVAPPANVGDVKSKFGIPDAYDPDVLEADARRKASLGFGKEAAAEQAKADANRKLLTEQGGLYIDGKFVPVAGWKEDKANQAATTEGYKSMIKNDETEANNYQARVLVENRIDGMLDIMKNFETGAFSSKRNELVAKLEDLGFTVPESAKNNPAAYQEFMKSAYASIFEQAKALGGRLLVTELSGLQKSGATATNTPEANIYILTKALGAIRYQNQVSKAYAAWRESDQGKIATSRLGFDLTHEDPKELAKIQKEIMRQTAYVGQKGPATKMPRDQLVPGQKYRMESGKEAYWNPNAVDSQGKKGAFQDDDPMATGD